MTYACLGEPQKSHHTSVRSKIRAPPHRCLGFVCRRQIQQLSCGCAFETWVSNTRLIKYELETYYRCFFCGGGPKIRAPPHCSSGPSLRTSQYYVSLADKAGNICDTGALRLQIQLHGERLIYTYQRTTLPPIQQKVTRRLFCRSLQTAVTLFRLLMLGIDLYTLSGVLVVALSCSLRVLDSAGCVPVATLAF